MSICCPTRSIGVEEEPTDPVGGPVCDNDHACDPGTQIRTDEGGVGRVRLANQGRTLVLDMEIYIERVASSSDSDLITRGGSQATFTLPDESALQSIAKRRVNRMPTPPLRQRLCQQGEPRRHRRSRWGRHRPPLLAATSAASRQTPRGPNPSSSKDPNPPRPRNPTESQQSRARKGALSPPAEASNCQPPRPRRHPQRGAWPRRDCAASDWAR